MVEYHLDGLNSVADTLSHRGTDTVADLPGLHNL
jgi:hypothetical protein